MSMPAGPCPTDVIRSTLTELYVKLLNNALRSRSPPSWIIVRGAKRNVGVGRGRRRPSFTSAKSPTSGKAMCPESDASVKNIDAVLGKVRLPCF